MNHNNDKDHNDDQKGKQGFGSMPKEKVEEIAKKGGQTMHKEHNDRGSHKNS